MFALLFVVFSRKSYDGHPLLSQPPPAAYCMLAITLRNPIGVNDPLTVRRCPSVNLVRIDFSKVRMQIWMEKFGKLWESKVVPIAATCLLTILHLFQHPFHNPRPSVLRNRHHYQIERNKHHVDARVHQEHRHCRGKIARKSRQADGLQCNLFGE